MRFMIDTVPQNRGKYNILFEFNTLVTLWGVQDINVPKLVYNRKSYILNRNLHINDFLILNNRQTAKKKKLKC